MSAFGVLTILVCAVVIAVCLLVLYRRATTVPPDEDTWRY